MSEQHNDLPHPKKYLLYGIVEGAHRHDYFSTGRLVGGEAGPEDSHTLVFLGYTDDPEAEDRGDYEAIGAFPAESLWIVDQHPERNPVGLRLEHY